MLLLLRVRNTPVPNTRTMPLIIYWQQEDRLPLHLITATGARIRRAKKGITIPSGKKYTILPSTAALPQQELKLVIGLGR